MVLQIRSILRLWAGCLCRWMCTCVLVFRVWLRDLLLGLIFGLVYWILKVLVFFQVLVHQPTSTSRLLCLDFFSFVDTTYLPFLDTNFQITYYRAFNLAYGSKVYLSPTVELALFLAVLSLISLWAPTVSDFVYLNRQRRVYGSVRGPQPPMFSVNVLRQALI